ncbi:MAG: asparaginase [Anaerolineales bacterium]|nr:asparaginase [Anaerolineales bacterium]
MKPVKPKYQPLFQRTRGNTVESIHYGAIAVVTSRGQLIAWLGDPQTVTFLRSSAKPLQALPLVENGGLTKFSITPQELALICASHSGTPEHLLVLSGLQRKINVSEQDLRCGIHLPFHQPTRRELICTGEEPSPRHHNCSGKHTGMLAQAKCIGADLAGYTERNHPVQQNILRCISELTHLGETEIKLGRDGCSVPTFALPLYHAAWAWAQLADPAHLEKKRTEACNTIFQAMTSYPEMVAGPERFDTLLMENTRGTILSKAGAEGYQALGIAPGRNPFGPDGLGIVLKIADGDQGKSVRSAAAIEVLQQLGVLSGEELTRLGDLGPKFPLLNQRGLEIGSGEPCFKLDYQRTS